ncbi:MAG: NADH-quinone oxidoreductase subunit H [Alistipes sp.]|nr:formate hydrogenlyase [Rikenellaceae bacterium]MBO5276179.1 NADH-quinone oxidoreductase subunit H [Alistipes sp.]MBP3601704.1 NADH-quinone oxidoreductase subunit H [Alistipes sp.]MBQ7787186.1 NADH-quinone oxidoreductase subunit H [Alistipes sp.]MBR3911941.1 NADH-quinone oxidoreductase subunit H [Alistipes sp.]
MGILFNTLLMIVVAIAIPGVINRTRALLAGRKGLPFMQHVRNVRLLLRKGTVYSTTTTALFRIAPAVYLGAAIVALLFIPIADLYPLISFEGDVICFAYTLALARVAIILAAMDTGSSFEGMGAAREALYGALIEPALMIGFATLAMFCGYTSFADIFEHEQSFNLHLTIVMFLIAYLFIKITFVESGRVPVDDPRTHLELTMIHEVMCLDYSGVDMGMIHIAGWLKTACFSMIAANAIAATCCFHWWFAVPLAILLTGISVGIVESTQARNKLVRNTTYIVTISALAALIFFVGYLLQLDINI